MTQLGVASRTTRGEVKRLLQLAWPVVVAQVGLVAMNTVDTLMVGAFGSDALAGIALGNSWSFALLILGIGCTFGLDPLFAQAHGSGDREGYSQSVATGFGLMMWVSFPVMMTHALAGPGLAALGQPAHVLDLAADYAWLLGGSVYPVMIFSTFRQALQARGFMRPAMYIVMLGNALNVLCNWFFMHGALGFVGMGAVGVGWSTLLVRIFMCLLMLWPARREVQSVLAAGWDALRPSRWWPIVGTALPVGFQSGLESWAFSASAFLAGALGAPEVAAHQVALNMSSLTFMVPMGISTAAATRVGNLMGAEQPWGRAGYTAVAMGVAVMSVSAVLYSTFPAFLTGLYLSADDLAYPLAVAVLPLAASFQLFDGMQVVTFGVLRGAGDTKIPSVANIFGYYIVGLPLGAYLAWNQGFGLTGVWMGLTAGLASVAAVLTVRLRSVERRGGIRVVPAHQA